MLKARPDLHERVYDILKKHWTVFSSAAKVIGETDLIEFEVELLPNTKPFRGKVRLLNPAMKQSLKEQLNVWEREGVRNIMVNRVNAIVQHRNMHAVIQEGSGVRGGGRALLFVAGPFTPRSRKDKVTNEV